MDLVERAKQDPILFHTLTDFILSNPPPGLVEILKQAGLDPSRLGYGKRDTGPVAKIIRPGKVEKREVPIKRRLFEYDNWLSFGKDMERRGDKAKAVKAYQKALTINPDGKEARDLLEAIQDTK
jgi:hypothetical protein